MNSCPNPRFLQSTSLIKPFYASWLRHKVFSEFPKCHAQTGDNWEYHLRLMDIYMILSPRSLCSSWTVLRVARGRAPTSINLDPPSTYLWFLWGKGGQHNCHRNFISILRVPGYSRTSVIPLIFSVFLYFFYFISFHSLGKLWSSYTIHLSPSWLFGKLCAHISSLVFDM